MKVAYLDCASGISGDMTLAALVDAGVDLAEIQAGIDSLGLASCRLVVDEVQRKGFRARQITVQHEPERAHRHLHHIHEMIDGSRLNDAAKQLARRIFQRLGEAEAQVHGTSIEKVHFHEVGAVDSIADVVGAAIGWTMLGVDRLEASPVPTGTGFVQIAHGRCSIPAPATAELLKGVPLAASNISAELTTPTGAAILATLVDAYGPVPAMTIETIGYGAGHRDLDQQPNLLRLLVGAVSDQPGEQQVWIVETNLDDATGELIGYCNSRLMEAGALDVYSTPIGMKKGRPGVQISVLCQAADVAAIQDILLAETPTLGVRRWPVARKTLPRERREVQTAWGPISGIVALRGANRTTFSPEYEVCRQVAAENNVPLADVYEAARRAFEG
jgi:uncharacterized protein (TIGR00299 family) protein